MESKLPSGPAPTPGAGDDRVRRAEAAAQSLPADVDLGEDDQTEHAELAPSTRVRAQRIEAAFERVAVGLALVSPQGRWLRVNQRLCDIFGYDREELAARSWQDLTFPDDRDACDAFFRQTLSGEQDVYEMDKRYVRKDGAPVWVHLTTSLVRTPAGEPDYFTTTLEDITERKRLEHERAQLQALTDTALSHLALDDLLRELLGRVTAVMGVDNVAILLLDEDGRTLTVRAGRGVLEVAIDRVHIQMGHGFSGRIAASREPLIVDDLSTFEGPSPLLRNNLHSVVGVPLLVDDRVDDHLVSRLVGVVHVGSAAPRRFTEADVQLLQRAADRIALAIGRARLYAAEQDARQRAEAALVRAQASEAQAAERAERLNTILDTMAEGVAMFDTASHPVQMNRAYRELHGVEREPLAAHASLPAGNRVRLLDLRDAATGAPLPLERAPVARALRGEMVTGAGADIRLRAFDGRELEVNSSAVPLRDGDGRIVGAVLVVHDLTERNRLAREREAARIRAERQADQLDRIFEAVTDGLVVWDIEQQQVRENAAAHRILGLDAAPPGFDQLPVRESLAHFAARDEQNRPVAPEEWPLMRVLRGKVGTGAEARDIRMRALDGREIEVNMSSAPLWDREGHLVGAVNVLHDLTERNLLERERAAARADELAAREVSRRMEAFLAVAAHDLRSPLTATAGFIALAQRTSDQLAFAVREQSPALARQVAAVRGRLEDADHSAARLTRLLTLLFDTAAVRADRLELHRAPCDLAALVREQVAGLHVAAPDRAIVLHAPAGGGPVPVEVDADRIGEVVANYLSNALKYSPPDRPVDVDVQVHGSWARVAVRDQGPGLPKEERARVWELFHRAPGVTAQDGMSSGSLGLGLYICKAIIMAHGGRVGVRSAVGEGCIFWFSVPLAPPSRPPGPLSARRDRSSVTPSDHRRG